MNGDDLTPERLKQIEGRWKSDVDLKLDRLVRFADTYEDLLKMLVTREKQREAFRQAVIEKTLSALILAGVVGLLSLAWSGLSTEIKAALNSVRATK